MTEKWKSVKISERNYLKIMEMKGNDGFDEFIGKVLNKHRKHNEEITELKLEIERLKTQRCTSQPQTSEFPTKEEFLNSIQENNQPYVSINPMNPLNVECNFHAYNPITGQHFCEDQKIDGYVCQNRYQRMTFKGGRCYPKHRENNNSKGNVNHQQRRSQNFNESTETPIPIPCLRGITVYSNNRQVICDQNCKLNHPHEYKACHEAKSEGLIHQAEAGKTSTW